MIGSIINLLGAGLSLWDNKEKSKYQDRYIELRRRIYEEENKNPADIDDSVLDNLYFELRLLSDSFSARVGEKNTPPKP